MNLPSRALLVAAGIGAIVGAAHEWRCNAIRKTLLNRSAAISSGRVAPRMIAPLARQSLRELAACRLSDIEAQMLRGGYLMALRRNEEAARTYTEILRTDPRPEVFLARGEAWIGAGEREKAISDFLTATRFAPESQRSIPDLEVRKLVNWTVYNELGSDVNLVRNGSMAAAGLNRSMTTTSRGIAPAPAEGWYLWNEGGRVIARRRSAGLEVRTTTPGSGIVQSWLQRDVGPENTVTEVELLVQRGRVGIGTGNGEYTRVDTEMNAGSDWHSVRAVNGGCPANQTIIYALTADAVFTVRSVRVRIVPAPQRACSEVG
jgi:hypothetical protein